MATRSRDVPDDELFMSRPAPEAEDCDSPTVEPLRIFKPISPKPADRYRYPAPPTSSASSSSSSSKPAAAASLPPLPDFPMPFGSTSSAAPLPYPDDRPAPKPAGRLPYPDDGRKNTSSPANRMYTNSPAGSSSSANTTSPGERKGGLAERRGTAPKPLQSPDSPTIDREELFARPLRAQTQQPQPKPAQPSSAQAAANVPKLSNAYQQKPYYPPPGGSSGSSRKNSGNQESNINRFASTASTSTTRASRGSPPPPETPIDMPGGGIEARYAAAGISGTATLTSLQASSAAAQSRLAQYGGQPPVAQPQPQPARPWTPTESPGQHPFGPPTVYQGADVVQEPKPTQPPNFNMPPNPATNSQAPAGSSLQVSVLEQDFARMQASTPPPAYTSVNPSGSSQYPNEKGRPANAQNQGQKPAAAAAATAASNVRPAAQTNASSSSQRPQPVTASSSGSAATVSAHNAGHPALAGSAHPAFANESKPEAAKNGQTGLTHTPSLLAASTSPPPLPEGWIAHLDQNSGQYYYIHLATQATQWEFPKGPNPLYHDNNNSNNTPLSPTASTYGNPLGSPFLGGGKAGLASPMLHPQTPGYAESIMSVAQSTAPTMAGFTGPPPSAGVEVYKVMPTNGVYFGPYLRYVNMDLEKGIWLGSIMIVTDAPQPPTIHIHLSMDLSPNPRSLIPQNIFTHQRWSFYKYDMDLPMSEQGTERWTYAVTSHLGCTRYEFVVAGRYETGWRMLAHSGNDFAPATNQAERAKLGGVGFMWKDILQKNVECGGFHVQLGLGDQIYGDRLWKEVPLLRQWLAMQGRENRKTAPWTARHEEDVSHAYFHYYTSHFDQPYMREAFAQIPHVLQVDDHDM